MGTWTLRSESDPRWDADGRGLVGMFVTPRDAQRRIDLLTLSIGDPPEDLMTSYMKD